MAYTAIQDRLSLTLAEVKEFMRIDADNTDYDVTLARLITASLRMADDYCQNDFLDEDDGVTELDIPDSVYSWCISWIGRHAERGPNGVDLVQIRELGSIKWGDTDYRDLHPYRMTWF